MIKPQDFYDRTVAHLVAQGHRAMSGPKCVYLAANGDKCALGVHIPDSLYEHKMDECQYAAKALLTNYPNLRDYIPDLALAADLQSLHDRDVNWDTSGGLSDQGWHRVAHVAANHSLVAYPRPTETD